ncbi:MAG: aldehyde dehydrogenase family protein [Rubrivivax sp.]|nr:aldehyde dehydrogenase family protein [Rubrivivax sp.]
MSILRITNPATGDTLAELPTDDAAAIGAKAHAARGAQPAWAARPLAERVEVIRRFRAAIVRDLEQLARTLTLEVGKPIAQSRNELNGLLGRLDFFTEQAAASLADETVHHDGGMQEIISHVPLGLVANISAWNYPWFVSCNVVVPALIAGNAVLYKPSEIASLSGEHLVRLLHEAGVPANLLHLVIGAGDTGAALLDQPVDGVFFTGSHATGLRIAQALQGRLVKLQLELGGKDPTYVRADADARLAAESLADGAMYNSGQSCCSVERIYVHEAVYEPFVEHFLATVDGFKVGDPLDDSTYIGAIARAPQLAVLDAQIADAQEKGATLRRGGQRLPNQAYAPTVFTEVDHSMDLMREESFGPVIGIQKVSGDDEAIALMNDTRYGLTAGVYTRDEAAARQLLSRVNAGSVYWNCCDRVSPRLPWAGVGDSGVGLTLSTHGIRAFTRTKAWHLRQP